MRGRERPRRATRPGTRSSSMTDLAAFAAGNDAPLIAERAAARGRVAPEGGDEALKIALSGRAPALRTVTRANVSQRSARGSQRDPGHATAHPSAFVAGNDAPLIAERAATRGALRNGMWR